MSGPFTGSAPSTSLSAAAALYEKQMSSLIESKCTNVVGSGCTVIPDLRKPAVGGVVCTNARAYVVEKQTGADPTLPGPGQYVNPMTDGRDSEGNYKVLLSTQRNIGTIKFAGGPSNGQLGEEGIASSKIKFDPGPGPGEYINPMTIGRGQDGEAKAMLSNQQAVLSTVWSKGTGPRQMFNHGDRTPGPGQYVRPMDRKQQEVLSTTKGFGYNIHFGSCQRESDKLRKPEHVAIARRKDNTPGPGHYIDPLKEGRNEDGEVKALLSNQHSVRTVKFGARPASAPRVYTKKPAPAPPPIDNSANRTMIAEMKLSTFRNQSRTVFAREPYQGPNGGGEGGKVRPSSAPNARGGTPGFIKLENDYKVSSKYRNHGGARWGPPGR